MPKHCDTVAARGSVSISPLLLLRRLRTHAFHRPRLAGGADIRACDLSGVASAGDAAIGPLHASRQRRLHRRIARRHGRLGRRVRHDIGGRQCLFGRAIRTRRRRFGSAGHKRRHNRSDEHERAAISAGPTSRQRERHHDRFISSQTNSAFFGERATSSSGSEEYPRCRHQVDADGRAHTTTGPRISAECRRL